jgi:uncharacterized membrane protein YdbT with pleckstrin-like domain
MDTGEAGGTQPLGLPEDATVVRQSQWSWLLFVVPWVVLALVATAFDAVSFGFFPAILAAIVVVPRYITYRSTAYILAPGIVSVQRGNQRSDLPISQVAGLRVDPGVFGRSLGYATVHLALRDGRHAALSYVPQRAPLVSHIQAFMDPADLEPGPPEAD